MRYLVLSIIAFLLSVSVLSAYETGQKFRVTANMKMPDNRDVFKQYLPFLENMKFTFRSYQHAPFSGTKSEEIHILSSQRLRTSYKKSVGLETNRLTIKVGFDYMFEIMEAGCGHKRHYIRAGVGIKF